MKPPWTLRTKNEKVVSLSRHRHIVEFNLGDRKMVIPMWKRAILRFFFMRLNSQAHKYLYTYGLSLCSVHLSSSPSTLS